MNKSDYKGMWVYIEHDHGIIHPVSLELCSEVRKLCDASGDAFTAVIIGNLPQDDNRCGQPALCFRHRI